PLPSDQETPWAPGIGLSFRGWIAAAHTPTCLRIADPVTRIVARLASGWSGWTLPCWDLHPLDDRSEFRRATACPSPFGPGSPGRTPRGQIIFKRLTGPGDPGASQLCKNLFKRYDRVTFAGEGRRGRLYKYLHRPPGDLESPDGPPQPRP